MAVVIALDAGTTGVRAFAVDQNGAPCGWAYREFTQHFPRPGWVEHDADEIWHVVQATLAELVGQLSQPIAAIGITNQRETLVAWSRSTGRPRARAIVWQDRRTAEFCDSLQEAGHLAEVRARTGLVLDPYFSASKATWWFREGVIAADADLALGTIDSWLVWNLTGGRDDAGAVHATDPSNASRTLLYDIRQQAWSGELAELFEVPLASLPTVMASSGRFGVTAADTTAVGAGIPISGIAGDQQAALFGQACFEEGMTKNTYGTGSFVLMNAGPVCPPPTEGLLTTVAWTLANGDTTYALEGAIFVTGAALQWLRDGLGIISDSAEAGPLATSVSSTEGVYLVPAFTGLGSPYWDPYARGMLVGLHRGTGRAHIVRAAVEAMAYQTRDVVEAMASAAGKTVAALRADGGASVMDFLLQFQADQLGVPVTRPAVTQTTALGAAYLAGLAEGVWSTLDEIARCWRSETVFQPSPQRGNIEDDYAGWLRAVERSRG